MLLLLVTAVYESIISAHFSSFVYQQTAYYVSSAVTLTAGYLLAASLLRKRSTRLTAAIVYSLCLTLCLIVLPPRHDPVLYNGHYFAIYTGIPWFYVYWVVVVSMVVAYKKAPI